MFRPLPAFYPGCGTAHPDEVMAFVYPRSDAREEPYAMGGGTYSRVVPNAISFGNGMPGSRHADFLPEGHGGAHGRDEVLLLDTFMESMKIYFISLVMLDRIL